MARTLDRLPRIKRSSGLRRLPRLGEKRERRKRPEPFRMTMPDYPVKRDETEQWIAYVYQDDKLAARVRNLQDEFPAGSIPELVVYDWLRAQHISFDYQVELFGGRQRAGGLVPDFLLRGSYQGKVIQVQGDYWHGSASQKAEDTASKLRLIGTKWQGITITSVVSVWEMNLRDPRRREQSLQWALVGMELPGG